MKILPKLQLNSTYPLNNSRLWDTCLILHTLLYSQYVSTAYNELATPLSHSRMSRSGLYFIQFKGVLQLLGSKAPNAYLELTCSLGTTRD